MKNLFVEKFILQGIERDLEEETKNIKVYYNKSKNYINENTNYIFEVCKKIAYKKIEKNISFITKNQIEKYYKNSIIEDNFFTLENEMKICKNEKKVNNLLFDMLNNSKKAFKRYDLLKKATEENEREIYSKYFSKSTSTSKKLYNSNGVLEKTITKTFYNHDNNGSIENFEDITQTTFLALLENKKYIFVNAKNKLFISKKAYYNILRSIDLLIKKTQKEEKEPSYEDLQERNQLEFLLLKKTTEETETETQKNIIIDILKNIDFAPKQKQILHIIYTTTLKDKDIYNNLNITRQTYYEHIRKIKKQILLYIKENNLQYIYNAA